MAVGSTRPFADDDGILGKQAFIGQIAEHEGNASLHRTKYLQACKRACGTKAAKIIEARASQPITFRPKSAWKDGDKSRIGNKEPFCGIGSSNRLVTGTIRAGDGTPPAKVNFIGQETSYDRGRQPVSNPVVQPVQYNREDGSFVFFTVTTGIYGSKYELGPYKSDATKILIEADGYQPLEVEFFDEMPHVNKTLTNQ